MIRHLFLSLCLLTLGTTISTYAHTVWIEPKDGQLVVRFAEPGLKFETSPGYLDNLSSFNAFVTGAKTPVALEPHKASDCFLLEKTSVTNTACVEASFTVRGGRKPIFYARWQPANASDSKPLLTLDIVPTGKPGEARIYFRGKPLPATPATLRGPDEKDQELTSDAEGLLHFTATQPGQYLLTVPHYREELAGFHAGVAYKETSHNGALIWIQP